MDLDRFKACCAAYGAQPQRWPHSEQALYAHFAASPVGAAVLADAERTDRFLDGFEPAPPDPYFLRSLNALARPAWRRFSLPAAALAACAVFGFVLGFVQMQNAADARVAVHLLWGLQSLQELGL